MNREGNLSSERTTPARRLRERLARPEIIRSMAVHDVLSALIVEEAGCEMVFLGGFGVSASVHGLPDLGLLGLAEMTEATRRMAHRLTVPLIADADTGHGDLHNAARCAREFEATGAAGIIIEDQVFPKRCGHFEGKQVIPAEEMELKLKAVLQARGDPDFVIIARTDARGPEGLDKAVERANRYSGAGADIVFVEAPLSREEIETIGQHVSCPKLINMLPFGKTPILPARELEALGYRIVVASIDTILLAAEAVREAIHAFLRDGHTGSLTPRMLELDELKRILGVEEYLSLRDNLSGS